MTVRIPYNISKEYVDGLRDGIKIANNILKRDGIGLRIQIPKLVIDNQETGKKEKTNRFSYCPGR